MGIRTVIGHMSKRPSGRTPRLHWTMARHCNYSTRHASLLNYREVFNFL